MLIAELMPAELDACIEAVEPFRGELNQSLARKDQLPRYRNHLREYYASRIGMPPYIGFTIRINGKLYGYAVGQKSHMEVEQGVIESIFTIGDIYTHETIKKLNPEAQLLNTIRAYCKENAVKLVNDKNKFWLDRVSYFKERLKKERIAELKERGKQLEEVAYEIKQNHDRKSQDFKAGPLLETTTQAIDNAFVDGTEFNEYIFKTRIIGEIEITSGIILVFDPYVITYDEWHQPLRHTFPNGVFNAEISIATHKKQPLSEVVAFARIRFSDLVTKSWEHSMLLYEESDNVEFNYGVDTGMGSFFDLDGYLKYQIELFKEGNIRTVTKEMNTYGFIDKKLQSFVFPTGYGDGGYPVYVGRADDNSITQLITDFGIV